MTFNYSEKLADIYQCSTQVMALALALTGHIAGKFVCSFDAESLLQQTLGHVMPRSEPRFTMLLDKNEDAL